MRVRGGIHALRTALEPATPAFFILGLLAFLLAQVLWIVELAGPGPSSVPPLPVIHLITLGWLTAMVMGALGQFVPIISGRPAKGGMFGWVVLGVFSAGVLSMLIGFGQRGWLLPAGGLSVLLSVLVHAFQLGRISGRLRLLPLNFIRAGILFLFLTGALGVLMASSMALSETPPALPASALTAHFLLGIFGWLTLTAMGVAYKLFSMFTLAPEERGLLGQAVFWTGALGAVLLLASPWFPALALPAGGMVVLSLLLFLLDLARLLRARKRRRLELNVTFGVLSFTLLFLAALLGVLDLLGGRIPVPALVDLALVGGLSGLTLSQLYKIVPFLTWVHRYGPLVGRRPVPRIEDLTRPNRDSPVLAAFEAGALLSAFALARGQPSLLMVGLVVTLLATLWLVVTFASIAYGRADLGPGKEEKPWPT